ncbi:MAG: ATP-dependent DNA helicase [Acidobacteriota bacterium]|nr:ATP-dependent DNA helicase [Acidobacteriota bacterium]
MAEAVARALSQGRHLVVQAGTGTGKSLAYLLPVVLSGRGAVVATATKALQDQLAGKDLPQLAAALGDRRRVRFAVLKGRANYLCRQRLAEVTGAADPTASPLGEPVATPGLFDAAALAAASPVPAPPEETVPGEAAPGPATSGPAPEGPTGRVGQLRRLVAWAQETESGDRADLDFEPDPAAWGAVSVTARECPGAFRCPSGPDCFAEVARARAAAADVVVVNTHLYATHVASGGAVLPDHEVVVFDEAHAVEDVMTAGLGLELTPGRVRAAAATARPLLAGGEAGLADGVAAAADRLDALLGPLAGTRVLRVTAGAGAGADQELLAVLELAEGRLGGLAAALRRAGTGDGDAGDPAAPRRARALLGTSHLVGDLRSLLDTDPDRVAWVEAGGPGGRWRTLRASPVEVGPVLAERLWPAVTAVLTSATVPPRLARHLGLPPGATDELDVGSPFPYRRQALLYCPQDLPDRRRAGAEAAIHEELRRLMEAAGGRTLALFTSWRAMRQAVDALRPAVALPVLAQGELPKPALVEAFAADEAACLFATMSFWQGIDVPGPSLSVVALDRLPFPRPDDPLLEARRERVGPAAFAEVDVPRAAMLLAQGAGRLIRSATDRGVVAVLDRRLMSAGYGAVLRAALPPMPLVSDQDRVLAFLADIAAGRPAGQ